MVEHNRDIRTAWPLQTDEGKDRQMQIDGVEMGESGLPGKHVKYKVGINYFTIYVYSDLEWRNGGLLVCTVVALLAGVHIQI